ncbi:hypothetical protein MASR1M8_21470 [Thermomonas brevis]
MRRHDALLPHLTAWKWWYAGLAVLALVVGSNASLLLQFAGEDAVRLLAAPAAFVGFAALALLLVRLASRRWPMAADLGLSPWLGGRDAAVIAVVFVASHALFWLLGKADPSMQGNDAATLFREYGLDRGGIAAVAAIVSAAVLAPVCEELLYRGIILRSLHDDLARRGRIALAACVVVSASAFLFALPHLGDSLLDAKALAYLASGLAFSLVYLLTGSLTAAMVSHSLQSCWAFAQILLFGSGDVEVPPLVYVVVFGCPLWTWLCAVALYRLLRKGAPD